MTHFFILGPKLVFLKFMSFISRVKTWDSGMDNLKLAGTWKVPWKPAILVYIHYPWTPKPCFTPPRIWVITPKNEGCGFPWYWSQQEVMEQQLWWCGCRHDEAIVGKSHFQVHVSSWETNKTCEKWQRFPCSLQCPVASSCDFMTFENRRVPHPHPMSLPQRNMAY